jgi:hypothetical protein
MKQFAFKGKEIFWKTIFKIGFIKKWYIGNEYLKNPPTVVLWGRLDGAEITNVTTSLLDDAEMSNCSHKSTLKLAQYF